MAEIKLPRTNLQSSTRRQTYPSILLLACLLFLARFLLSSQFGFYEDDYTLVVRGMASNWHDTWQFISNLVLTFGGQGRPLQHSLLFLIAHWVGELGGIRPGYIVAFFIVLMNCSLFYVLIRKLTNHELALLAAIFYTLYSADTTQAFLYHAYGLQQSLTFFMLAGLAYRSDKHVLSYVLITGSLLSYENTYLVFLAFPLLCAVWDKNLIRRMLHHILIMMGVFAAVAMLRITTGESRVASLSWPEIITTPLIHMIQGPFVAAGTAILRPLQSLQSLRLEVYALSILAFAVFFWITNAIMPGGYDQPSQQPNHKLIVLQAKGSRISLVRDMLLSPECMHLRFLLAGVLMLVLAYPLTFTVRAYAISGRDTRVHFAAIFGYALVWSSFWWIAISFWRQNPARWVLIAFLSLNLALLSGFGLIIQRDYARAWDLQQSLWSSILANVPDLEEGTIVFIDPAGLDDTRYIDANTWSMPRILPYIFEFPENWEDLPEVYRLWPDWEEELQVNYQEVKALDFSWSYITSAWKNTVFLTTENNTVSTRLDVLNYKGRDFTLKAITSENERLPCGYIYDLLIETEAAPHRYCR